MKQLFAFVLLIATGLLLLTVLSGLSGLFAVITSTWTATNTTLVASTFTSVLFYAGVVTVSVLGFALFTATTKGRIFGSSRSQQTDYQVIDGQALPTNQAKGFIESTDFDDWYDIETESNKVNHY